MRNVNKLLTILMIITLLLCACTPAAPSNTRAVPQTTATLKTTAAPETTVPPETTVADEATTAPTEPIVLFGNALFSPEELVCFPGLSWDMTREDVIAALNLAEGDYTTTGINVLTIPNAAFFGISGAEATFYFEISYQVPNKQYMGLRWAAVTYPEDADMSVVKAELEALYGSPSEFYGSGWLSEISALSQDSIISGYQETGFPLTRFETDDHNAYWSNPVSWSNYATADWRQTVIDFYFGSDLPANIGEAFMEAGPTGFIYWSDDFSSNVLTPDFETKNLLFFSNSITYLIDQAIAMQP